MLGGTVPLARVTQAPGWQILGGFLGAHYVWSVIFGVPTLGVVTTTAALILGQMVAALFIDTTGFFDLTVQALTPQQVVAAELVLSRL